MLAPKISQKLKAIKYLKNKIQKKNEKVKKFKRKVFFPWYGLGAISSAVGVGLTIAGIFAGGILGAIGSYCFLGAAINNFLAITTNVVTEYKLKKYAEQLSKCDQEMKIYQKEIEQEDRISNEYPLKREENLKIQNEFYDAIYQSFNNKKDKKRIKNKEKMHQINEMLYKTQSEKEMVM